MKTFPLNLMDEFPRLAAEVFPFADDARVIDRLTTAGGYSQLLEMDPSNDEYLRKFGHAVNELRMVLRQQRESLLESHNQLQTRIPS